MDRRDFFKLAAVVVITPSIPQFPVGAPVALMLHSTPTSVGDWLMITLNKDLVEAAKGLC